MTLPLTGPISASDINIELGNPQNTVLILGNTEERELAGVPTGEISYSDFYGKSLSAGGERAAYYAIGLTTSEASVPSSSSPYDTFFHKDGVTARYQPMFYLRGNQLRMRLSKISGPASFTPPTTFKITYGQKLNVTGFGEATMTKRTDSGRGDYYAATLSASHFTTGWTKGANLFFMMTADNYTIYNYTYNIFRGKPKTAYNAGLNRKSVGFTSTGYNGIADSTATIEHMNGQGFPTVQNANDYKDPTKLVSFSNITDMVAVQTRDRSNIWGRVVSTSRLTWDTSDKIPKLHEGDLQTYIPNMSPHQRSINLVNGGPINNYPLDFAINLGANNWMYSFDASTQAHNSSAPATRVPYITGTDIPFVTIGQQSEIDPVGNGLAVAFNRYSSGSTTGPFGDRKTTITFLTQFRNASADSQLSATQGPNIIQHVKPGQATTYEFNFEMTVGTLSASQRNRIVSDLNNNRKRIVMYFPNFDKSRFITRANLANAAFSVVTDSFGSRIKILTTNTSAASSWYNWINSNAGSSPTLYQMSCLIYMEDV